MCMITVLYASAGGATRDVVATLARQLGPRTRLVDLASFDPAQVAIQSDLVIAGGPTYGRGDWHHLWGERFADVAPMLVAARQVALFGLGDSRFHGGSFCGGLRKLYDSVRSLGTEPIGFTLSGRHSYRSTPSLVDGCFPGLVVDYRLDRRHLEEIAGRWLDDLVGHDCPRASFFFTAGQTKRENVHVYA